MTTSENKPAGGFEKALLTHSPIIILAALCVWAYVDLKSDLAEIRAGAPAPPPAIEEGPAAPDPGDAEKALPPVESPRIPDQPPPAAPASQVDWECKGEIAHEKVIEAVGRYGQAVFDCYSETLTRVPDLKGTLLLELNVGTEGQVREARVKGPITEQGLLACVSESVYGWTLTPPVGGECAVVSVPFLLDPAEHPPKPAP